MGCLLRSFHESRATRPVPSENFGVNTPFEVGLRRIILSKKRATVFVFYDKDGIVDRFVTYLLQSLLELSEKLVIVCNGKLNNEGEKAFRGLTEHVLIRKNEGYDAWGFKAGIEYIGWDNLSSYDELVLMNDSVYGPIYPFSTMFEQMDNRNLDFWGITKHGQTQNLFRITKDKYFPEHIQSYFYSINKKMFSHNEFKAYWDNLYKIKSLQEAITYNEVLFTEYFAQRGFSWDVYVDAEKIKSSAKGSTVLGFLLYDLVTEFKLPVIKRKIFSSEHEIVLDAVISDVIGKTMDYIRNNTSYDTEMMWENILRTMNLKAVINNLNLAYVLPCNHHSAPEEANTKTALFAHISDETQIEVYASYASAILNNADIFISTISEDKKSSILSRFSEIELNEINVVVVPGIGEKDDASILWQTLSSYMGNYDCICLINSKIPQDKQLTFKRIFTQRSFENTLASRGYVQNIIKLFKDNPRLGVLIPPPYIHGYGTPNQWGTHYNSTLKLANELDINVQIDKSDPVFPAGGMFWFRPKALKKLIEYDWGSDKHSVERIYCYAAQSEGYYSACVCTDDFASKEVRALSHLVVKTQEDLKLARQNAFVRRVMLMLKRYPRLYDFAFRVYHLPGKLKRKSGGA
jgi:rhamnosyltransferase